MRVVAAFAFIAMAVSPAAAQPLPRLEGLLERVESYLRLVERYLHSDDEGAVRAITDFAGRSPDALEDAVEAWRELTTDRSLGFDAVANRRPELQRLREPRTVEGAVLLHTVAGMVGYAGGGLPVLRSHLAIARRATGLRGTPSAAARAFDVDWNRAVAVFFHARGALEEAKPYMEAALSASAPDRDLLVAAARLFEAHHARGITQLRRHDAGAIQSPGSVQQQMLLRARADADIARAEVLLREALAIQNAFPAARLRLGRVLQTTARGRESEAEFRAVIERSSGDDTEYFARLFLARVFEDSARTSEAAEQYEAATRLRPRNQTARIGLARLLALEGRRADANALVRAVVTAERAGGDDPWWVYYYPDENALTLIVARMRERLR